MSNLKKDIDEIVFRCFAQGQYWGTEADGKLDPGYKPEKPIDRTQAVNNILNLIESVIPKTLNFKPKSNSSCSFEMDDTYANPCEYCGGTRMYDWREFTKKYGFTPNNIDGYNQCIADIKSKLIGEE